MSQVGYLSVSVSGGLLQVLWSDLSIMFLQVPPVMSQYILEYLEILQKISHEFQNTRLALVFQPLI